MGGVLAQVVVAPVGDALELVPAPREQELHVARARRVVRQLVVVVGPQPQLLGRHAQVEVPVHAAPGTSTRTTAALSSGGTKYSISICSNSRVRNTKLPGRDLVAERLADLGDAERRPLARRLQHVLEVDEHALRRLGPQVDLGARALDRAGVGLEHEVELPGLGEAVLGAAVGAHLGVVELVEAEPLAAVAAVDQRVGEVLAGGPTPPTRRAATGSAASRPTMSWRSCTIDRHHASFTFRSSRTPTGP